MEISPEQMKIADLLVADVDSNQRDDLFLTRSVLRVIAKSITTTTPEVIASYLQIDQSKLEEELGFLLDHGLIQNIPWKGSDGNATSEFKKTSNGELYFERTRLAEIGQFMPSWKYLKKNELVEIINTVKEDFKITYGKNFIVQSDDLEKLFEGVKTALNFIHAHEQAYLTNLVKPSFKSAFGLHTASFNDPTWADGLGHRTSISVAASIEYPSLEAALFDKVSDINGKLKIPEELSGVKGSGWHFMDLTFTAYDHSKEGFYIWFSGAFGPGSDFWQQPVEYQRGYISHAAKVMTPVLGLYDKKRDR